MGRNKLFPATLIFLAFSLFLFSCRNISPEDLQKDDLIQIIDFLFDGDTPTEPYIELTYEAETYSSATEDAAGTSTDAEELMITPESADGDFIFESEDETALSVDSETVETTAAEKASAPNERVMAEYPEIPAQFSSVPLPASLLFTDNIKTMISNLTGLAKRDFNSQSVYIAATKPELLTPNLQNVKSSDTKYYRNALIEKKYNVNISSIYMKNEDGSLFTEISKSIDSGEYFSDILCLPLSETLKLLYSGRLYNLRKTPFINFNAPYYNQSSIIDSQIKNSLYMLSSDFTFDPNELYAVYLNKDLLREKCGENIVGEYVPPAQYVESDSWSFDDFFNLFKTFNDNIDAAGNGAAEETPAQFLSSDLNDDNIIRTLVSSGGITYYSRAETLPELNFNSENDYNIIEKLKSLLQGYMTLEEEISPAEKFASGNAPIFISTLEHINDFTSLPFEWTLLPIPKSEASGNLSSYPSVGSIVISLPKSVANTELCGIMIEALSISSYNLLKEDYVNEKMIYNLRDINSVKILKEIINLDNVDYKNTFSYADNGYASTTGYIKNVIEEKVNFYDFFEKASALSDEFFKNIIKNNNIY